MRRILLSFLSLMLLLTLAITGCARPAPAPSPAPSPIPSPAPSPIPSPAPSPVEPIELRLATSTPIMSADTQNVLLPWTKDLENRTEGKIKVTLYPAETLARASEMYNALLTGICDIATITVAFVPGRFPLSDVFELPYTIPYADSGPAVDKTGKPIEQTIYEKYLIPIDYKEAKVLTVKRFPPGLLLMATKSIRTLEDLKGLVIGIPGGKTAPKIIKAWGAAPETVTVPDMYTALERKLIAGHLVGPMVIESFKLYDLLESITLTNVGSGLQFLGMRHETWASLPPDIQKIIDETVPSLEESSVKSDKATVDRVFAGCKEKGIEVIELSPQEMQRFIQATEGCEEEWVAEIDAKGLPGTEMVNEIHRLLSE